MTLSLSTELARKAPHDGSPVFHEIATQNCAKTWPCQHRPQVIEAAAALRGSGGLAAEIRYGGAQDTIDQRALLARETVFQRRDPCPHRIEVGNDGLCRDDARDADFRIGLVVR